MILLQQKENPLQTQRVLAFIMDVNHFHLPNKNQT